MVRVDPQVFFDDAAQLSDIGSSLDTATTALVGALRDTALMSGTGDTARTWATSHDTRAGEMVDNARKLAETVQYFGSLVAQAGYNHALANYNADINPNKGRAPDKPPTVPPPTGLCWVGAPASGGPGQGLISGIGALMEKIHVHVPDGDTDKLARAAKAWRDFIGTEAVAHAAYRISGVNNTLGQVDSPEIPDLMEHVTTLQRTAHALYTTGGQLATICENHKKPLDKLRRDINHALTALEEALAVNLVITIFADVITAGIGVLLDTVSLAKAAKDVDTAAIAITDAVEAAQLNRILGSLTREDIEEGLGESTPAADSLAQGGVKPTPQQAEDIVKEADRTGSGMKSDPMHRSASFPVNDIAAKGTVFEVTGGDGVTRTLAQMPGEVNGVPGRFEWIIDDGKVTHQMFVRNGTINGVPIRP